MATSSSTDFTLTRNEIIRLALLKCNAIDPDETVSSTQQTDASKYLNMFVKRVSADKPLFGVVDYIIPLYDEKQFYTIGSGGNKNVNRPLAVTQGRRRDSSNIETPVFETSRNEYMDLPLKSSTGIVNQFCYDKQLNLGVLYVWPVASTSSTSLSDGSADQWTDSGVTAGEYYYTGSDISAEPTYVFADGTELTKGPLGSLSNGEYAWGDQDTLGADTLYIKTALGDPDAQASGYVKVLTSTPDKLVITAHRPLEDFNTSSDNPDFPQDALEMLVDNLAAMIVNQYAPHLTTLLKQEAMISLQMYFGHDTEDASMKIYPRYS